MEFIAYMLVFAGLFHGARCQLTSIVFVRLLRKKNSMGFSFQQAKLAQPTEG
jgi:hypothetical protein